MKLPNVKAMAIAVQNGAKKNTPQILMAFGIGGMITTTILAVKATPKAIKLLENAEEEKRQNDDSDCDAVKLTPLEIAKATWKVYIPAVSIGTVSVICLIGSSSVSAKRTAALATAYKISETALSEYKDAIVETVGEKKAKAVKDKVAEKKIEKNPLKETNIIITDKGYSLCFDTLSGRYFKSDMNTIKKAENEINLRLREDNYVSLNTLYDILDISHTKLSEELGWSINTNGSVELEVSAQIADDGQPCLVIDFSPMPIYDYWKL